MNSNDQTQSETVKDVDTTGSGSALVDSKDSKTTLVNLSPYAYLRKPFILIVLLQLILMFGCAVPKGYTLMTGQDVLLPVEPVDPLDMFRGEYARLKYKNVSEIQTQKHYRINSTVYVLLQKDQAASSWRTIDVFETLPKLTSNQAVLKGQVLSAPWSSRYESSLQIKYGIERLFMPPGLSADLERHVKDIKVNLAVRDDGDAVIKRVYSGNKLIFDGTKWSNRFL